MKITWAVVGTNKTAKLKMVGAKCSGAGRKKKKTAGAQRETKVREKRSLGENPSSTSFRVRTRSPYDSSS